MPRRDETDRHCTASCRPICQEVFNSAKMCMKLQHGILQVAQEQGGLPEGPLLVAAVGRAVSLRQVRTSVFRSKSPPQAKLMHVIVNIVLFGFRRNLVDGRILLPDTTHGRILGPTRTPSPVANDRAGPRSCIPQCNQSTSHSCTQADSIRRYSLTHSCTRSH